MITSSLDHNISSANPSIKDKYVQKNIDFFGENVYSEKKKVSLLDIFFDNCKEKILFLLFVAALLSLCISFYKSYFLNKYYTWIEGASILMAIFIIIVSGTVCEYTQALLFEKINAKKREKLVKIVKKSDYDTKNIDEIIVGDVIYFEAGDAIPADCYLLSADSINCDESMITGESSCVEKNKADPFLIGGSHVIEGTGTAVVLCVGKNSVKGQIIKSIEGVNKTTPLQKKVAALGERLSLYAISITVVLFTANILKILLGSEHLTVDNIILNVIEAVSIAVMAVPEGLGMSITLSLSFGTKRMLKDNNLVRDIASCEVMNNVNYLCIDKTGTLTQNEMFIKSIFYDNEEINIKKMKYTGRISPEILAKIKSSTNFNYFAKNAILNSSAFENSDGIFVGSRIEIGLLKFLETMKIDYKKMRHDSIIIQKRPFNSGDKYMATCVESEEKIVFLFKGAPEKIINKCRYSFENNEVRAFDKDKITEFLKKSNQKCQRTLAFAFLEIPRGEYDNYIVKKDFTSYKNYNAGQVIEKEKLLD
ncbi:Calcium-transporting ATPase PAT1, partial [Dictyocoela roeselum]